MRAKEMDYNYSGLKKGMRLQAEADGKLWAAEIVAVSLHRRRPIKARS